MRYWKPLIYGYRMKFQDPIYDYSGGKDLYLFHLFLVTFTKPRKDCILPNRASAKHHLVLALNGWLDTTNNGCATLQTLVLPLSFGLPPVAPVFAFQSPPASAPPWLSLPPQPSWGPRLQSPLSAAQVPPQLVWLQALQCVCLQHPQWISVRLLSAV